MSIIHCDVSEVMTYCDALPWGACPNVAVRWLDQEHPVCADHVPASSTGSEQ